MFHNQVTVTLHILLTCCSWSFIDFPSSSANYVVVLVIPFQLCYPTTEKDEQKNPPKDVQSSVIRLNQLQNTSSRSVSSLHIEETNQIHHYHNRHRNRYLKHWHSKMISSKLIKRMSTHIVHLCLLHERTTALTVKVGSAVET